MMPEDNPFIGRKEVPAIFEALGRGRTLRIECQNFRRDELAIEAISERVSADGSRHEPQRIDLLTAM